MRTLKYVKQPWAVDRAIISPGHCRQLLWTRCLSIGSSCGRWQWLTRFALSKRKRPSGISLLELCRAD